MCTIQGDEKMNKIEYKQKLKRSREDTARLIDEIETRQQRIVELLVRRENMIMEGFDE